MSQAGISVEVEVKTARGKKHHMLKLYYSLTKENLYFQWWSKKERKSRKSNEWRKKIGFIIFPFFSNSIHLPRRRNKFQLIKFFHSYFSAHRRRLNLLRFTFNRARFSQKGNKLNETKADFHLENFDNFRQVERIMEISTLKIFAVYRKFTGCYDMALCVLICLQTFSTRLNMKAAKHKRRVRIETFTFSGCVARLRVFFFSLSRAQGTQFQPTIKVLGLNVMNVLYLRVCEKLFSLV